MPVLLVVAAHLLTAVSPPLTVPPVPTRSMITVRVSNAHNVLRVVTRNEGRTMTSPFAPRVRISAFLAFIVLVCAFLAFFPWSGVDLTAVGGAASALYLLGIAVVLALILMRPRDKARRCPKCGRQRPTVWGGDPEQPCPACRIRELPPRRRRRAQYTALRPSPPCP